MCPHEYIEDSTDFSIHTQFLQIFFWISSNKFHTNFYIFHTLALKIMKHNLLIWLVKSFPTAWRMPPKFQYGFQFWF
jgi:hypothetical protein